MVPTISPIDQVCENLYLATCFLDAWDPLLPNDGGPRPLEKDQAQVIVNLFNWASRLALPSSEFAVLFDETAEITPGKDQKSVTDRG